jgi:hypothetical protein
LNSDLEGLQQIGAFNPQSEIRNPPLFLPLALLEAWVFLINYEQLALTANDFTIGAALLDGCSNFHVSKLIR